MNGLAELDVRDLKKPDKHPTIFATYDALAVGDSFVLVNNHDPKHLRDEFELEHPGGYSWDYLDKGPREWRIRIGKAATTSLPRILCDTTVIAQDAAPDVTGAVWKLRMQDRDLDSNIIRLPAGQSIDAHDGPDLDVLIHVLQGSGELATETGALQLRAGVLAWMPRRSRRQFTAGPDGLVYLTVHQRRRSLGLDIAPAVRG